jgi:hypothetical protein
MERVKRLVDLVKKVANVNQSVSVVDPITKDEASHAVNQAEILLVESQQTALSQVL